MELSAVVNGRPTRLGIEPQELLLDVLRDRLGLTGAKRSCDVQVCGACTVLVDGAPVSACTTLAADVAGREVLTIEGLRQTDAWPAIEDAFERHAAVQCGFCTPGMALTIHALVADGDMTDARAVQRCLSGNLCRCTGYRGILEAAAEIAGVATEPGPVHGG
ncbi:MAG: 2Fe-2S iron-sulfur cluster binding domain-containing protein [Chloroflexi bacterium]|nr:2Fe-2S iron-sulfur cluster binding domain-containing protein [Chloroflexota bacterium]